MSMCIRKGVSFFLFLSKLMEALGKLRLDIATKKKESLLTHSLKIFFPADLFRMGPTRKVL